MDTSKVLTNFKTFLESMVIMITLILGLLFILAPITFNNMLSDAGFEEGSVVGFKWKLKLSETDSLLKELRQENNRLSQQNIKLLEAINSAHKIHGLYTETWVTNINIANQELLDNKRKLSAKTDVVIENNDSLLVNVRNTKTGIVYSGDSNLPEALYEITVVAKKYNIPNPTLFYRNNSFRSVSVIDDKENAKDVLYKIKQFRSDAYIVDLNIWCKNPETKDKYTICS